MNSAYSISFTSAYTVMNSLPRMSASAGSLRSQSSASPKLRGNANGLPYASPFISSVGLSFCFMPR